MFTILLAVAVGVFAVVLSETVRPVNFNLLELPIRFGIAFICFVFGNALGRIRIGR
jgi:hypothetical protein